MSTPLLDTTQVGLVSHETDDGNTAVLELGTKVAVGSQSNKRLLAWIGNLRGGAPTAVHLDTTGGAAFIFAGTVGRGEYGPIDLWYLDNVEAGDHTICLTTALSQMAGVAILESWYNVDLTIPPSWVTAAGGSSISITSTSTQAVSCCQASYVFTAPSCTDGTQTAQKVDGAGNAYNNITTARKLGVSPSATFAFSGTDRPNIAATVLNVAIAAAPTKLGVLSQSTTAQTHHSFTITVAVQDAGGATVTGNTDSVTLAPSGTGTATFSGNLTVSAVAGVATFTLTATKNTENASITFTASSGALTPAEASAITLKVQSQDVTVS